MFWAAGGFPVSTPTDEQQLRATLRRAAKRDGADGSTAARMALVVTANLFSDQVVGDAFASIWPDAGRGPDADRLLLPELMGAKEAADYLNMAATNLKALSPPLPVAQVISGRIPVYLRSDVEVARERRLEQGRLRGAQPALDGAA